MSMSMSKSMSMSVYDEAAERDERQFRLGIPAPEALETLQRLQWFIGLRRLRPREHSAKQSALDSYRPFLVGTRAAAHTTCSVAVTHGSELQTCFQRESSTTQSTQKSRRPKHANIQTTSRRKHTQTNSLHPASGINFCQSQMRLTGRPEQIIFSVLFMWDQGNSTQHTTHNTQRTTHNAQRTTHNAQRTTHNSQLTTHNSQLTTHNAQRTTHNTQHTQYTTHNTQQYNT